MKNATVLIASLLLLLLGSPLLGQEGIALPGLNCASNGVAQPLMTEAVQATPVALGTFTLPIETKMTGPECRAVSPCCECVRYDGISCAKNGWEPC